MSATSRGFRAGDAHELGRAPLRASPRRSLLHGIVATRNEVGPALARLTLGIVMFPHAMQKAFGWFGGYGLTGTYGAFTGMMGLPGWLAALAIAAEIFGSVLLIVGAFTRLAAAMILAVMIGAIVTVHVPNGFFMNWTGQQKGEGFEYHVLAIGLSLVVLVLGAGVASIDRLIARRANATGE